MNNLYPYHKFDTFFHHSVGPPTFEWHRDERTSVSRLPLSTLHPRLQKLNTIWFTASHKSRESKKPPSAMKSSTTHVPDIVIKSRRYTLDRSRSAWCGRAMKERRIKRSKRGICNFSFSIILAAWRVNQPRECEEDVTETVDECLLSILRAKRVSV